MYVDTKEAISTTLEPSLSNLAYLLRHKELWPKGFEWNFCNATTCAIGLAEKVWAHDLNFYGTSSFFGDYSFDALEKHDQIFTRPKAFWKMPFRSPQARMNAVTPEIVANRIDKYLVAHVH